MRYKTFIVLVFPAVLSGVVGCVRPGGIEEDTMYRLQQAVLARSPQGRSKEGLGLMRPVGEEMPVLKITKDAKSGVRSVRMSVGEAIMRALANNAEIAVVSYDPQVAREQMVQAAAAFDYVLFGSFDYNSADSAYNYRSGVAPALQKNRSFQMGVRQRAVTGATWQLSDTFVRSWDNATTDSMGRWYQSNLEFQVTQPLLRDAWPEFNLAALRIARLNYKISMSQFRDRVEQSVAEVINIYYQFVQARREVKIAADLLAKTQKTYKQVIGRQHIDATKVNISQAAAAVKSRQAVLVQTEKSRKDLQDALVRLLGDSKINLLQDYEIIPTTQLSHHPVKINQADQLLTALRLNPALEQARLAIKQARINIKMAKNQTLPELNLSLGTMLGGASRASRGVVWDDVWSGRFASYNAQLTFEYPIGNRERQAALAESRLLKRQVVTQMQNTADQLAQGIRERIRHVYTSHEEFKIQGEALAAVREQLEALEALEKIRAQLTPEFLNLKLNAQAEVALAERAQLAALVQYNTAIVDLNRATGSILEMNQVKLALPTAGGQAEDN